MRLEILVEGGTVQVPGSLSAPFSTVALLRDGERNILVDPGSLVVIGVLEEKFERLGLEPEDITDIILTHFHLDHAYNSVHFENATVHLHSNYAVKDYSKFGTFTGREYMRILNSWRRVHTIEDGDLLFDKIRIYHTPWHAREHVSLLVETENFGKVFFPGDICYTRLDYYEIVKGYRKDDVAEFVKNVSSESDLIVFTHDSPLKPLVR